MNNSSKKLFAAKLSITTALSLAILKFITGIMTGSMAVLSSAIDSVLDILMSAVNFLAIRHAEQPADDSHAYGHGKFETMAALVQALIIGGSGVWILIESINRLITGSEPQKLGNGIVVLAVSVVASWLISRYLVKVALETDSPALQADSLHFAMDVYTNLALAGGLVLMYFFDIPWLDGLLSILVSCYIMSESYKLIRQAMKDVLDEQIPKAERNSIENIIRNQGCDQWNCHDLRTRKSGSHRIIDFHLTVCKNLTVDSSHGITEMLEEKIEDELPNSDIIIHIEPCSHEDCQGVPEECTHRPKSGDEVCKAE
ncbi:cation diffusion facilitator family transporter [Desulfopila sp. IMCC35008]|uniref:cation diffusion facilitator family transporter n=1 Tax=Desulfopila sp. IMCC35008 TaxID=2653858 RepID=UPI0013D041F3|nr:cation diffusion facilitator family transporter [Desulfopila sp. IMCC35008]